jgi:hypothetical protein
MSISTFFSAGETKEFFGVGDYFRLLSTSQPVDVTFYYQGRELSEALNVLAGYGERLRAGTFDRVAIFSPTAQTVQFVTREGADVQYDRGAASVEVTNNFGNFTQGQATVTNSNQVIWAARNRRYLMIQNRSATGTIWVAIDGNPSTTARGIRLGPGDSYELAGYCTNAQLQAIGDIPSNSDVLVVESL